MTIAWFNRPRRPRPRLSFDRIPRRRFEEHVEDLKRQRDRAVGQRRAHTDRVAAWLEQVADSHQLDAEYAATPADRRLAHRMTAADLRQLANDLQEGPNA